MARGQGISAIGMGLGMGLGILMAGQIAEWWGWRFVFILYSIPSFLACFLVWKIIKDPESTLNGQQSQRTCFASIFRSGNLWMLYLAGFTVMYMFWVLGTWAPAIFLELGVGGIGSSGIYAGIWGLIGVPALIFSGIISDKMKKKGQDRHYHLVVCLVAMCILAFLMGLGLDRKFGLAWFVILLLLGGIAVWSFSLPSMPSWRTRYPKIFSGQLSESLILQDL